jgi:GTP cyclohydrolase II
MFPELVTRTDSVVFLPPIGGATIYMFGNVQTIADPSKPLAVRVHDECNGSDVFGSDICTCRPYLAHGHRGVRAHGPGRRRGGHRLQPQGGARRWAR